ncbi:hypothetical protein [Nonomuraea typhae]|uniref:Uncharacterized protein n=1 Tax=Nonomuraea typhae TaxID=2603600 RepID=A0ABW7Z766_9ACTN
MAVKRLAIILAAALTAGSALSPPAHAAAGYLCLLGTAVQTGEQYTLSSTTCTGSGLSDVPVIVRGGQAAGNYRCQRARLEPLGGDFRASGCTRV